MPRCCWRASSRPSKTKNKDRLRRTVRSIRGIPGTGTSVKSPLRCSSLHSFSGSRSSFSKHSIESHHQKKDDRKEHHTNSTDKIMFQVQVDPSQALLATQPPEYIPTPPGYNKQRRDMAKLLLSIVAVGLLSGNSFWGIVLSIGAILCIKEGTVWSAKNMWWMTLSIISFASSLTSYALLEGRAAIDEEKGYGLYMTLSVVAKLIQVCWGVTLSVFLYSAYSTHEPLPPPPPTEGEAVATAILQPPPPHKAVVH
jgi:hypothetical protein